ncbi:UDP-2,4-diacetamido-2,4,6-trideoxy-beta-L-altropyranose hydrolase [Billgrantia sp. Q4P2]
MIGSGHVMRCLTLADVLKSRGSECHFLCREHSGHLIGLIRSKGYTVHELPCELESPIGSTGSAHAAWLGTSQEQDMLACRPILQMIKPDWLIVDHYALDICWEESLRPFCDRLMAIDDLADRTHCADLLLDQNLGRQAVDYVGLVPDHCCVLLGPAYALLRPEFSEWRQASLERRQKPQLRHLLITMGGVDIDNVTTRVLEVLRYCNLPNDMYVTIIMGATAPWLDVVQQRARMLSCTTVVLANVSGMAQHMADADLAIGAAGSTSWERCCLGLPTLMLALAENQLPIAECLHKAGAAIHLGETDAQDWIFRLEHYLMAFVAAPDSLDAMVNCAASLTHGQGAHVITDYLLSGN